MTATMTATRQRVGFRPDIEGLRAVAVLAVVLFHADIPGITGGYIGVDVFFVISGFLITGLLWREANTTGTIKLHNFYGARARRLLPASATVGIITMIASVLVLPPLRVPTVIYDGIASALYVGNYWFIIDHVNYFADLLTPSPFLHYWSLGVEEQFYLVWAPLFLITAWLIRLVRRFRKAGSAEDRAVNTPSQRAYVVVLALIAVTSFALSLIITHVVPPMAFFSLTTRAWQLAIGGLLALTAVQWRRLSRQAAAIVGWAGLGMILLGCVWFTASTPFPGTAALLPTVGSALVIGAGCATPDRGCGQFLSWSPMGFVGRISYSLYLWHWPVLVLGPALLGHSLGLPARLVAILLAGGLAWLTLRFLENPLRFTPKIHNSGWRSLALGGVATALAVCTGLGLLRVIPSPVAHGARADPITVTAGTVEQTFAQVQAALAASLDLHAVPSNLSPPLNMIAAEQGDFTFNGCLRTPYEVGQPTCLMGDATSTTRVALLGDSHAAMWTPAFLELAAQRHWRLQMLAKEACPIIDIHVDSVFRRLIERLQHCEEWRAEVMARMRADHPQLVIVSVWRGYGVDESMSGFTGYDRVWLESISRVVRQLRDTGAAVLVLGPIPAAHFNVPICLSGNLDDAPACTLRQSTSVNQSGIAAEDAATTAGGGQYADLTDLFCTTERCPVIVGNTLVYLDVSHLTLQYARVLAPAMGALVDRALATHA